MIELRDPSRERGAAVDALLADEGTRNLKHMRGKEAEHVSQNQFTLKFFRRLKPELPLYLSNIFPLSDVTVVGIVIE